MEYLAASLRESGSPGSCVSLSLSLSVSISSLPVRASTPQNKEETQSLDFLLPESVKDFVFDLHDAMRRAKRVDELETLYNTTFKAVTDAYFKGVSGRG